MYKENEKVNNILHGLDKGTNRQKCPFNHDTMKSVDWFMANAHYNDRRSKNLAAQSCRGYHVVNKKGRTVVMPCNKKDEEKLTRVYIYRNSKPNFNDNADNTDL